MDPINACVSSSTKLAIFFSGLLAMALVLLSVEVYTLTHGDSMEPIYSKFILALIIFICVGLFFVSFYVTKRINVIAATAERIIATRDLSQRIPIDSKWDDLGKLSGILNSMLDEIEQLVASVRQVSDNVAHDLRHPLTRLRNHIEMMREDTQFQRPAPAEQQEQFSALITECDALLTTFNALLRIANIESGRRHAGFHEINLSSVVQDVIELYEPLAIEKTLRLSYVGEPTSIVGDKDLLFQAIANLLDNAIKHTPTNGVIEITVNRHESGAQIIVADTGRGISDEHKQHVFRRFYRVAACRSQPGSGLGLSLVAAIIRLHQGQITLSDNHPAGLIVTITL